MSSRTANRSFSFNRSFSRADESKPNTVALVIVDNLLMRVIMSLIFGQYNKVERLTMAKTSKHQYFIIYKRKKHS